MKRIILIGLSGTGKSAVASELARRLGYRLRDTDAEVARVFGRPIPAVFASLGEEAFRAVERRVLRTACATEQIVVATGGGVPADETNWPVMRPESLIVHLAAEPSVILDRIARQTSESPAEARPLLDSDDPAARLAELWRSRRAFYERADITVDTSALTVAGVVDRIVARLEDGLHDGLIPVASLGTGAGRSDLHVASGSAERLGELARRRWPQARSAWVVTDDNVGPLWLSQLSVNLAAAGFQVEALTVPAGEGSKSWDRVAELMDWMLRGRIDRRDVVVALGGGVIGDLAGFAASIVLRGVGLIQVPTSLLAMVDSSVGGKTGINHAMGKNLVGTFYQPQLVVADPVFLRTLPERQLRAGWAEIVKHAMIERTATGSMTAPLLAGLESADLSARFADPTLTASIVASNVLIKSAVVEQDERETGLRRILNYGHTLGHAMEASGYRYLHGEAVALGMRAAARIALRLGMTDADLVARQDALLDALQLPRTFAGELDEVLARLQSDKKAVHGRLTWVLPTDEPGSVRISSDVPAEIVTEAAIELGAACPLAAERVVTPAE